MPLSGRGKSFIDATLRAAFTEKCADGLYCAPDQPNIRMELSGEQPQIQGNGYAIYRIDGLCGPIGQSVRFELQIKALVHVFWAEVEHEIIYKNNRYLLMDTFMKEMLSSAYDNLRSIDRQLYLIYNQIQLQSDLGESNAAPGSHAGDAGQDHFLTSSSSRCKNRSALRSTSRAPATS